MNAKLTIIDQQEDLEACETKTLSANTIPISDDALMRGQWFCALTNEGRFVEFSIQRTSTDHPVFAIEYTTGHIVATPTLSLVTATPTATPPLQVTSTVTSVAATATATAFPRVTPTVTPVAATPTRFQTSLPPVQLLCFAPKLRHFEAHFGCCAEVAGLLYNSRGQPFDLRGAFMRIEGPPAADQYVREFAIAADGSYNITALSTVDYTIWLKGPNISSQKYEVRYTDPNNIRAIIDFHQVDCDPNAIQ